MCWQVGGGPTGTELAAEMNDLVRILLPDEDHIKPDIQCSAWKQ